MTLTTLAATPRVLTLGQFALLLRSGDEQRRILPSGKPLALLTYLALTPRRAALPEVLIDLLWSDRDANRGRQSLRQTVYVLRQLLGEHTLQNEGGNLRLTVPVEVDATELRTAARLGETEQVLGLYGGPFLDRIAFPGGGEFEQWATQQRGYLDNLWRAAIERAAREALRARDLSRAERLARRLIEVQPHRQAAWRLWLEALSMGPHAGELDSAREQLRLHLVATGAEPEPATRALLSHPLPLPDDREDPWIPDLVGRAEEFSFLAEAWRHVARGGGSRQCHVSGPSGVGKSRLAREISNRARALGGAVVFACARSSERSLPYAFAAELTSSLIELPGAAGVSPGRNRPWRLCCRESAESAGIRPRALRCRPLSNNEELR